MPSYDCPRERTDPATGQGWVKTHGLLLEAIYAIDEASQLNYSFYLVEVGHLVSDSGKQVNGNPLRRGVGLIDVKILDSQATKTKRLTADEPSR